MKKSSNSFLTRLLFIVLQIILVMFLIAPSFGQNYTRHDLDNALNAGIQAQRSFNTLLAIEEYSKAVTISESLYGKEHPQTGLCYHYLGMVYGDKGGYDMAVSMQQDNFTLATKFLQPKRPHVDNPYNFDQAIFYFEKSLAIRLKTLGPEHPDVATAYVELGLIYHLKEDYDRAIAYCEKALVIRRKVLGEEQPGVVSIYIGLGVTYLFKGDKNKAISYFEKAVAISLRNPIKPQQIDQLQIVKSFTGPERSDITSCYNYLAIAYSLKGDNNKAISSLEKALAIRLKVLGPEHRDVAESYNYLGEAYQNKGDYDTALPYYLMSRAITKKVRYSDNILLNYNIGCLYMKKKQFAQAKAYFQEAIAIIEKDRLMTTIENERDIIFMHYIEIYQYALKNCILTHDTAGAFQIAEMMKERGFIDRLSLNAALKRAGIDYQDYARVIELTQEIESLKMSLIEEYTKVKWDRARIFALENNRAAKAWEFTSLQEKLFKNDKYLNLIEPSISVLQKAQTLCDTDTAILEYVIWEGNNQQKQSYCLVITKNDIQIIELSRDFEYSKTVKEFRRTIVNQQNDQINQKSALLFDKLFMPLKGSLKGIKRFIVVPDGELAFLPFDALKKWNAKRYLGQDYMICLCPSISVMSMIKQRSFSPNRSRFLAFGGVCYAEQLSESRGKREGIKQLDTSTKRELDYPQNSGKDGLNQYFKTLGLKWANLPGTLEEVNTIANKIFNKKDTMVITGIEVSEAKLKAMSRNQELSKYQIIHFACHGFYNRVYPSLSSIVFSEVSGQVKSPEDGYLSVEEASKLNLNADIVNLSACETGLGKIEQGLGIIGLTRAFMVVGANSVGVTLWTVDDKATVKFMVAVYEKVYKQGKTYIEAYAETKREFMRSKQYSSPYYWCPFVLYGQ